MESNTFRMINTLLDDSLVRFMNGSEHIETSLTTLSDLIIPTVQAIDRDRLLVEYKENLIIGLSQTIPIDVAVAIAKNYQFNGVDKLMSACQLLKRFMEFTCYRVRTNENTVRCILYNIVRDCESVKKLKKKGLEDEYSRTIVYKLVNKMLTYNENNVTLSDAVYNSLDDKYAVLVDTLCEVRPHKLKSHPQVTEFINECRDLLDNDQSLLMSLDVLGYDVTEYARYEVRKRLQRAYGTVNDAVLEADV
nr:27kDa protein [Agapanthus velarivirus]